LCIALSGHGVKSSPADQVTLPGNQTPRTNQTLISHFTHQTPDSPEPLKGGMNDLFGLGFRGDLVHSTLLNTKYEMLAVRIGDETKDAGGVLDDGYEGDVMSSTIGMASSMVLGCC
jgi:hypothetical protein